MDMHAYWNLMLETLPVMGAFENMKEHSIPFYPCLTHYLHFIMNFTLVVVLDHLWMWMLANGHHDWWITWNAPSHVVSHGLWKLIKHLFGISNAVLTFLLSLHFFYRSSAGSTIDALIPHPRPIPAHDQPLHAAHPFQQFWSQRRRKRLHYWSSNWGLVYSIVG
jgi:hypothetical protein